MAVNCSREWFTAKTRNLTTKPETKMKDEIVLQVDELEERIAPSALGNPGNNNPPLNNTNNPGNEGTGGQVSTGH